MNTLPSFPPSLSFLPTRPLTHPRWGDFLGLPLIEENLQLGKLYLMKCVSQHMKSNQHELIICYYFYRQPSCNWEIEGEVLPLTDRAWSKAIPDSGWPSRESACPLPSCPFASATKCIWSLLSPQTSRFRNGEQCRKAIIQNRRVYFYSNFWETMAFVTLLITLLTGLLLPAQQRKNYRKY